MRHWRHLDAATNCQPASSFRTMMMHARCSVDFQWNGLIVHYRTDLLDVNRNLCFVCRVCPENGLYLLFVRLIYDCLNILTDLKKKLNLNLLVCGACPENWSWLAGTCQSTQTIGRSDHKNRQKTKKQEKIEHHKSVRDGCNLIKYPPFFNILYRAYKPYIGSIFNISTGGVRARAGIPQFFSLQTTLVLRVHCHCHD